MSTPRRAALIAAAVGVAILALATFLRSSTGTQFAWHVSGEGAALLPLLLISAVLDSLHPCAFAILLVTIAVLLNLGALRSRLLAVGGVYVAGIFVAYLGIGLGILGTLRIFAVPNAMGKIGAAILIVWGLIAVAGALVPTFPIKLQIPHVAHRKMAELMRRTSIPAAFGLGVLVGMCAFPCAGGPYLVVLGLLHDTATYVRGFAYLLLYNVIFVLPLIVVLLVASDPGVLGKLQEWKRSNVARVRISVGVAMVLLGLLVLWL